jgi:hypothetical protein
MAVEMEAGFASGVAVFGITENTAVGEGQRSIKVHAGG